MPAIFERLGFQAPRYSAFDLSREQKLSFNMGELIPTLVEEILPGDQFKVSTETMMRLAPMLAPIMHRVNVYMHYFFVPNRLIWDEWESFITGGKEGESVPIPPIIALEEIADGDNDQRRLGDYLGLPIELGSGSAEPISLLPFRAYSLIWNEYYRDENLMDPINITDSGECTYLLRRCWEKDYFTSALPWLQRGAPVGVPIELDYSQPSVIKPHTAPDTGDLAYNNLGQLVKKSDGTLLRLENLNSELDFTINELRRSSALQRWLEKQARGGYRYIETILSHFGVKSDDARLQRPEYLGGGRQPIVISEVLNTTGTEEAPQGDMAGHGISVGQTMSFNRRFTEHGWVMGIMSVLPRTAYQQGLHRKWSRTTKEDYFWPEFANLGEQEIKGREIFCSTVPAQREATWGYQQRYAEYKYAESTVHGDFRNTLDYWHMGRKFSSYPTLSRDFMEANPTHRIFAVTDPNEQKLWCQLYHKVHARRPMPYFADPRLS